MSPGLLYVQSKVTRPSHLSDSDFCAWYENTHIQEVMAVSGIPVAARYEALEAPQAVLVPPDASGADKDGRPYQWLTLYEMEDVNVRNSEEFRGLDGQTTPKKEVLEGIFRNAGFDTRFFEEIHRDEGVDARTGPANLVIAASLTPRPEIEAEFESWYRQEHIPLISKVPGYCRTRRYKIISSSKLHEYQRIATEVPSYLAVHEFEIGEGEGHVGGLPMQELVKCDETEWSKRILKDVTAIDAGFWRLKRVYGEWEKGSKL